MIDCNCQMVAETAATAAALRGKGGLVEFAVWYELN